MMTDLVEIYKYKGHSISIYQDADPMDPRKEFDNGGVMVCLHRSYDLGDRKPTDTELRAARNGSLERYLRRYQQAVAVLPLGLLDHGGLYMYVGSGPHWTDGAGWDSGCVGFIYLSASEGVENPESLLRAEVEEYNQYLTGECYGYVVKDEEDEVVDSCWGFYGWASVKEGAESAADY